MNGVAQERAAQHVAAVAALDEGGAAAAVEEEDDLLAGVERLPDAARERAAEDAAVAGLQLFAQVDDLDCGQRRGDRLRRPVRVHEAVGQFEEAVRAVLCVEVALDVRRRGAEHEDGAGLAAEALGGEAGVVAGDCPRAACRSTRAPRR